MLASTWHAGWHGVAEATDAATLRARASWMWSARSWTIIAPPTRRDRLLCDEMNYPSHVLAAGVDLGGTAINYTFVDEAGRFLIDRLFEHPARSKEGPDVCLSQIAAGLELAARQAGIAVREVAVVGLDTPGPATATGVLSARGSTNFVHPEWAGFDIRAGLERTLAVPVTYLNDGNAAALWGHVAIFGAGTDKTSISAIVGTGLGGGVITGGDAVVKGRRGFGGELGHVLIPYQSIAGIEGIVPACNCLRTGDLESLCSLTAIERTLLPYFLERYPGHELHRARTPNEAAKRVRGLAERGDDMCRRIFQVQAHALGLFFDEMINVFDPDAFIVGGGAIETSSAFQQWFIGEIRAGMPVQRAEQAGIPIHIMPNGDCAGARGAAIEAVKLARRPD
jgi:predicted NBD/HSP70 family sugar kinase